MHYPTQNCPLKSIVFIGVFSLLLSCNNKELLTFETTTMTIQDIVDCSITNCVVTEIELLHCITNTKTAHTINTEIEKVVATTLYTEDKDTPTTVSDAMTKFNDSYIAIKKQFPDEITPYEASVHCQLSFQNQDILSILIDTYIFTGGAHGNGNTTYLTIDTSTGKQINTITLFKEHNQLLVIAEKAFRKHYNIPYNANINSTGFFFDEDEFQLPENIGFTDMDVILHYNQYEISTYADGPIIIQLKKNEVASLFSKEIL